VNGVPLNVEYNCLAHESDSEEKSGLPLWCRGRLANVFEGTTDWPISP
jgi:hypothetical protein